MTSSFPRWAEDPTAPFLLQLACDLTARGWHVDVLAPHAAGLKAHEILHGVAVTRFRYFWPEAAQTLCYQGGALFNLRRRAGNRFQVPAFLICQWLALRRLGRSGQYQAVHAHWVLPQGLVAVLAGRGAPVIISVHGSDVFALRGRIPTWCKRWAMRRAAAVTANSSATEAAIRAIAPGLPMVRRIPMGAAMPESPPSEARQNVRRALRLGDGPVLLFVGRLVAQKGVDDLLQALAILTADWPAASVIVVGDGPERALLEARARTLNVANRVRFTGLVEPSRVPDYLAAADILVAPSKADRDGAAEGQGLVVIEAMLASVPVIASRSGGMVDMVRPDETGVLVDEGAPAQIAKAVTRLLGDRDLARRLARQAREVAMQSYTADAAADAFSRLFAEVAAPPLSRRSDDAGP